MAPSTIRTEPLFGGRTRRRDDDRRGEQSLRGLLDRGVSYAVALDFDWAGDVAQAHATRHATRTGTDLFLGAAGATSAMETSTDFASVMRSARLALLANPDDLGESRARLLLNEFLRRAGTPRVILARAEDDLLGLCLAGVWESSLYTPRPLLAPGLR